MNDERTAMLTAASWPLPVYAQTALRVQTDHEIVGVDGSRGEISLTVPSRHVMLRWGHDNGPALALLHWQPDCLEWDGSVRLGGALDSLYLTDFPGLDTAVAVLHFVGQPLQPDYSEYTRAHERETGSYLAPVFLDSLTQMGETMTTWLVAEDSPLMTLAQDAMVNNLRVWFKGRLAAEGSGWDGNLALPLLLESVTVFAP